MSTPPSPPIYYFIIHSFQSTIQTRLSSYHLKFVMVMPYSQATARKERDSNLKIIPSVFVLEEVENLASSSVQLLRAQRGKQRAKNKKKTLLFALSD